MAGVDQIQYKVLRGLSGSRIPSLQYRFSRCRYADDLREKTLSVKCVGMR
jgi:hypothetical protein